MSEVKQKQHWSKLEERGSVIGMKILFSIYRLLGRKVLWIFLFPVVLYLHATGSSARQASVTFLSTVNRVRGSNKTASYLDSLKHFCRFADSAFDKIDAWLGRIKLTDIDYNNSNLFLSLLEKKQGAVFIGSHLGNLEVCRALSQGRYATTLNVLVFTQNAVKFNQILESVNPSVSLNLIQVNDIGPGLAMTLKDKVDQGEIVVIVGDRTSITTGGRVVYAPFLGEEAPFSQGPFILASLLDCPVYWLFCLKHKGRFKVIFEHVADKLVLPRKERAKALQNVVEQYASRLSYYASQYPYQWFNFFDFWHKDDRVSRK
ncbi:LpxL/LpxP family acyltransferase [Flocculibacter collagenilyticus]|uniref:LpxL/LpxP family acyltransferase n=1 Tax=Flocculibacter collagenilyticus TaxID=2744479 RepID=UPI0018F3E2DA|nr:acyltransferase [Flocculibacter collagenilyticus]